MSILQGTPTDRRDRQLNRDDRQTNWPWHKVLGKRSEVTAEDGTNTTGATRIFRRRPVLDTLKESGVR